MCLFQSDTKERHCSVHRNLTCSCKSMNLLICGIFEAIEAIPRASTLLSLRLKSIVVPIAFPYSCTVVKLCNSNIFQYFIGFIPIICIGSVARDIYVGEYWEVLSLRPESTRVIPSFQNGCGTHRWNITRS